MFMFIWLFECIPLSLFVFLVFSLTLFWRLTQSQSCSEWRSSCGAHEVQCVDVFSFTGGSKVQPALIKSKHKELLCLIL